MAFLFFFLERGEKQSPHERAVKRAVQGPGSDHAAAACTAHEVVVQISQSCPGGYAQQHELMFLNESHNSIFFSKIGLVHPFVRNLGYTMPFRKAGWEGHQILSRTIAPLRNFIPYI
jgi:hypothetical protein